MNKISKIISKALTFAITMLLVSIFYHIGITFLYPSNNGKENDKESVEVSSPVNATLLDVSAIDAMEENDKLDSDSEQRNRDFVNEMAYNTSLFIMEENLPQKELPNVSAIEMELIYQNPELPTGCESVALTMVLKHHGFDLEKTTIAKDYLVYSTNFVEGYVGNPFSGGGAGIYSPGLTKTANKYLNAQESEMNARNVTGSTPEELYWYVAEGNPVVVWNTIYMANNYPSGQTIRWGDKTYQWDNNEHCVVLSGYDLERNMVIIHDPISGVVERDADAFWEKYENLGSMALIISD